ncbi:MAG TPA: rod shape-determining protein MreC [Rhizomicrobium sp.]|jgi:rod shape-determining protein MreC|nr:rod shape-determining protein MreC [Rhizomicrobium sp.]
MANGSLRVGRPRAAAQISLAVCAALACVLIFLGRVQPTLFDRARAYASDRAAPVLEAVRTPIRAAGAWAGSLADVFHVYQVDLKLKDENARLRKWQNLALSLQQRLKRYQLLLNAVPDPEIGSVTAHVIGRASRPFLNTMIVDAGRREHLKPGEAVVDDRGMIGRIFVVGDHTSWVILLTDLNSRIPVSIEPGNVQAMLTGDNSGAPLLVGSAQGARLRSGQQVVTSGDGALLPAGLAVGKLYWDGGDFRVALFADAGRSGDVRVLDLKLPAENPPAPTANDLPVTAAGLPPLKPAVPKPATPTAQPAATAALTQAQAQVQTQTQAHETGVAPSRPKHGKACDTDCLNRKELRQSVDPHIQRLRPAPASQLPLQQPPPPDETSPDDQ